MTASRRFFARFHDISVALLFLWCGCAGAKARTDGERGVLNLSPRHFEYGWVIYNARFDGRNLGHDQPFVYGVEERIVADLSLAERLRERPCTPSEDYPVCYEPSENVTNPIVSILSATCEDSACELSVDGTSIALEAQLPGIHTLSVRARRQSGDLAEDHFALRFARADRVDFVCTGETSCLAADHALLPGTKLEWDLLAYANHVFVVRGDGNLTLDGDAFAMEGAFSAQLATVISAVRPGKANLHVRVAGYETTYAFDCVSLEDIVAGALLATESGTPRFLSTPMALSPLAVPATLTDYTIRLLELVTADGRKVIGGAEAFTSSDDKVLTLYRDGSRISFAAGDTGNANVTASIGAFRYSTSVAVP